MYGVGGSEERMSILNMLAEGKITAEEAERLLQALGASTDSPRSASSRDDDDRQGRGRRGGRRRGELNELVDEIGEEVRGAVQSLQGSEIGRVVRKEVRRAVGSLQRLDMGAIVGDVVEQMREVVGDAVARSAGHCVEQEKEWSFAAAELERLQAETVTGLIHVEGADTDQVTVHARQRVRGHDQNAVDTFAEQLELRASEEGRLLRLYQEPQKPPRGVHVEVQYRITCPASLAADLRLVNGNLEGLGLQGGVDARSTNGNVRLSQCAGRTVARTRNGNVRVGLQELRHEALLETTNGNVALTVQAGQAPIKATSMNGNVKVMLPVEYGGQLEARTTNGVVTSELVLSRILEQKRNLLVGQLGETDTPSLHLQTTNGNVRIAALQSGDQETQVRE